MLHRQLLSLHGYLVTTNRSNHLAQLQLWTLKKVQSPCYAMLQVALKACQKQLAAVAASPSGPDAATLTKLHQLEGALRQASRDYALILGELTKIRGDAESRQAALAAATAEGAELRRQLESSRAECDR